MQRQINERQHIRHRLRVMIVKNPLCPTCNIELKSECPDDFDNPYSLFCNECKYWYPTPPPDYEAIRKENIEFITSWNKLAAKENNDR